MKMNIAILNRAGRWFGGGYTMKPDSLFRHLAGNLPGVLLWLAVLPLAALGQANYATPYTFITIAGAVGATGSADGTNSAARFNNPYGVAVDTNGNLYVSDSHNETIRRVMPVGTSWVVTTLAGKPGVAGSADGTNSTAQFNFWNANIVGGCLAVDSAGNIYVPDTVNNTIREVTPAGVVTTLAGLAGHSGTNDGTGSAARFYYPGGVAVDTNGNLYVADCFNDTIREVTPVGTNWVVTTLAGLGGHSGANDGTGSAGRFNIPAAVAVDTNGNLYVADFNNETIRKVTPVGTNWVVTTLAGKAGSTGSADGTGSAARFSFGSGDGGAVAADSAGNLYVPDYVNNTIRKGFPASSVPPPILQPPNLSAGLFGFGITGLPNLAVNIESSTNLSSWQVTATYILSGGTNYYSVSPNPALGAQFYRAQVR
jgi:hypothetical protein